MFMMSSTQPKKEVGFWSWWWSTNKTDATSRHILITLVPLFIFFWFMFLIKKRNNTMNLRLPPGPRGLPIVGYLPFLGSNLHQSFKELTSSYGAIFRIWLGMNEYIIVSSPSLAKEVLRDQDTVFANRLPTIALKSLLFGATDIAFSDYGHELRKMRKLFASEMMSRTSLDASYSLRIQHVTRMLNEIYMKAGEQVDIGAIVFLNLMSAGMSMIWGDKLEADTSSVINSEFRGVVNELFELLGKPNISDLFPFLARFDLQGIAHQMKIISSQCEKILNSVINCRNAEEDVERKDFLGFLLQLTECEDPTRSLTLPQVKAILMDAVIGGTDTTAATVEWGMAEILQHPKVLEKVQEELTEVVGLDSTVDEVHLPKLKYLKAVLKETLRLHPPLPLLIPHCPSEPSTIGGFSISKGVSILVNAYAIHRDPKYWEDPLVFQPERFLSTDNLDYKGNHFNYLPFGSGRRICAGISLAERMSLLFLASLLHAFRWELPNDTAQVDFSEKIGLVMTKAKPLFAVPTPKLSSSELYSHKD